VVHFFRGAQRASLLQPEDFVNEMKSAINNRSQGTSSDEILRVAQDQMGSTYFSVYALQGVLKKHGVSMNYFDDRKAVKTAEQAPASLFECVILNVRNAHWKAIVRAKDGRGWLDMDSLYPGPRSLGISVEDHPLVHLRDMAGPGVTTFTCFNDTVSEYSVVSLASVIYESKILMVKNPFKSYHDRANAASMPESISRYAKEAGSDGTLKLSIPSHSSSNYVVFFVRPDMLRLPLVPTAQGVFHARRCRGHLLLRVLFLRRARDVSFLGFQRQGGDNPVHIVAKEILRSPE
jgi:hypothetical protein